MWCPPTSPVLIWLPPLPEEKWNSSLWHTNESCASVSLLKHWSWLRTATASIQPGALFVITGFKICKSIFKAKYKPRMFMYPSEGRRGLCPNILCKSSFCCCTWAWININDCFKMRKKRNFILHQKKKQLYFYCINNGKIKIFLYRVYIYSSVWLEETADTYGIRFSFYTHLYTLG